MPRTPGTDLRDATPDEDATLKLKEYKRQYHIKNREKIIKKVHVHYVRNREKRLAYGKKWRDENPDKMRLYRQAHKNKLRKETFEAYGGAKCRCCGEAERRFLTIDHINNDGAKERREMNNRGGYASYARLRARGFPGGYQVLCFNCNMAKGHYGACPHTTYAPL